MKNNQILSFMEQMGYTSVSHFCQVNDMQSTVVGELVNMKRQPFSTVTGEWTIPALKLANALVCSTDDLWPDIQRSYKRNDDMYTLNISDEEMTRLMYCDEDAVDNQDNIVLKTERNAIIDQLLHTLTPREEKIIRMRFGLLPYNTDHTLEECAHMMDEENSKDGYSYYCLITRERVRQIEAHALCKLRNPKRSCRLLDFIGG